MGCNAISAVVGDAYRHIDQLLGQGIQGPIAHHLLDVAPDALQVIRVMCQNLPKIIHPVRLAGGHDVVINGTHSG